VKKPYSAEESERGGGAITKKLDKFRPCEKRCAKRGAAKHQKKKMDRWRQENKKSRGTPLRLFVEKRGKFTIRKKMDVKRNVLETGE